MMQVAFTLGRQTWTSSQPGWWGRGAPMAHRLMPLMTASCLAGHPRAQLLQWLPALPALRLVLTQLDQVPFCPHNQFPSLMRSGLALRCLAERFCQVTSVLRACAGSGVMRTCGQRAR